jgi:glucuronate isomerase
MTSPTSRQPLALPRRPLLRLGSEHPRAAARALYDETRDLPLICPHGRRPGDTRRQRGVPEPTALLITPDHYIFRMLYSRGVSMESLGVPTRDGSPVEQDPRKIWQRFGDHYHLFRGTPTGAWFDHELHDLFGVRVNLDGNSAAYIYQQIAERLASPEFRRVRCSSDQHQCSRPPRIGDDPLGRILGSRLRWGGRVIPTRRIYDSWRESLNALAGASPRVITNLSSFVAALGPPPCRASLGATAERGRVSCTRRRKSRRGRSSARARGTATPADQRSFEAHMPMEMAMSVDDGLVMQLHAGASRSQSHCLRSFGADKGADLPVRPAHAEPGGDSLTATATSALSLVLSRSTNRRTRES